MRRNIPIAVITALIAALLCIPAVSAMAAQTVSREESAEHTIVTVSGSDSEGNDGKEIILVKSGAGNTGGKEIITVESGSADDDGREIITVESKEKPVGYSSHKVITVSGGDTVAVEGEAKDARLGYEVYSDPYTVWDSNADGYDDYYSYVDNNIYNYNYGDYPEDTSLASASDGYYGTQTAGYDYSGIYPGYNDGYSDYYSEDGYYRASRGFSGPVILAAMLIGFIVALTFYSSTKSAYENAGIGVVYDLKDNAVLKLAGNINRQIDTRSTVDRGYFLSEKAQQLQQTQAFQRREEMMSQSGHNRPQNAQARPPVRPQVPGHPGMTRPGGQGMNNRGPGKR